MYKLLRMENNIDRYEEGYKDGVQNTFKRLGATILMLFIPIGFIMMDQNLKLGALFCLIGGVTFGYQLAKYFTNK